MLNPSLLDLFRQRLGVERLSKVGNLNGVQAFECIEDAFVRWSGVPPEPPPKPSSELRPVIGGFTFSAVDEVVALSRALLVAQSAALIVPDSIGYTERLVRLLFLLEDAVDKELVVLLPEQSLQGEWPFTERLKKERLALPPLETSDEGDRLKRADQFSLTAELAIALDACHRYPDRLDIACTRREQTAQLRSWMDDLSAPESMQVSHDRLYYLPELLSLELPRLNLPVADLVAVREEGLFEEWQRAFQRALAVALAMQDDDLLDPESARLAELRARLAESSRQLSAGVSRSRVLRRATTGTGSLAISCAAGALGSVGGPVVGLGVGGGAFITARVVDWLGGRPSSGERAFRRLAVHLFEDDRSG